MKHKVYFQWIMCDEIEIEADSIEKAIEMVEEDDTLTEDCKGEYVDYSFEVNEEATIAISKENNKELTVGITDEIFIRR